MPPYRIDRVRPEDGARLRAIRLQMLQDAPTAYLETYQEALAQTSEQWRQRAARRCGPGRTGLVAVDEATGAWVGSMGAYVHQDDPQDDLPQDDPGPGPGSFAWLVAVWVHPGHRGPRVGVADRLLDAVVAWARDEAGVERLLLEVHEANARAMGFYRRRGFVLTGRSVPYLLDPSANDLEMALRLT